MNITYFLRVVGAVAVLAATGLGILLFALTFFNRGGILDFIILVFAIFGAYFVYWDIIKLRR